MTSMSFVMEIHDSATGICGILSKWCALRESSFSAGEGCFSEWGALICSGVIYFDGMAGRIRVPWGAPSKEIEWSKQPHDAWLLIKQRSTDIYSRDGRIMSLFQSNSSRDSVGTLGRRLALMRMIWDWFKFVVILNSWWRCNANYIGENR